MHTHVFLCFNMLTYKKEVYIYSIYTYVCVGMGVCNVQVSYTLDFFYKLYWQYLL